jgi:hypothetical protein
VSLSGDGNTAIVGGPLDLGDTGAVWVYARSGGVFGQTQAKLAGVGAGNWEAHQGSSVALSADGSTAIVGGDNDGDRLGAIWVYAPSGGVFAQQGGKLVGTGFAATARQGSSVSLSADGNTALVGGLDADHGAGAAWIYTRGGGVFTQQGPKLVASDEVYGSLLGFSAALSGDGTTAIVGGPYDGANIGAAWVFTRIAGVWTQQGSKLV